MEHLSENKILITDTIQKVKADIVAITAHGAPKGITEKLAGKTIIDTTCPYVIKFQQKVSQMDADGYQLIILGDENHPEIRSIMSFARSPIIIESPDQVSRYGIFEKIALLSQTTQTARNLQQTALKLVTHTDHLTIINTICPSTRKRQADAVSMSEKVKVAVVIGGHMSANTSRLVGILKTRDVQTFWVERSDDLTDSLLCQISHALMQTNTDSVGLISGASTPSESVKGVKEILNGYSVHSME